MKQGLGSQFGRALPLYLTGEHHCSYLAGVRARTLFVDPGARIDGATYQRLIDQGFRRSGTHIYRPACCGCSACIPVRLPVDAFVPNRSQRRNWRRNAPDIALSDGPAVFRAEQFELYRRYLAARHANGVMAEDASEDSIGVFWSHPGAV
jgi:Putative arginyl-tRNA:protein arginylyltransferase